MTAHRPPSFVRSHETGACAGASALKGRRIAVVGNSGSGKTTLAAVLSRDLAIPHVELDALNWGPGWTSLSAQEPETWARRVAEAVSGEGWITDGNYSERALPEILPRATDVIWLDYPRHVIMVRVLRRSFQRALSPTELWPGTGNREDFRRWLQKDHPIRWAWDTHHSGNDKREGWFEGSAFAELRRHRFRTPAQTRRWARGAARAGGDEAARSSGGIWTDA